MLSAITGAQCERPQTHGPALIPIHEINRKQRLIHSDVLTQQLPGVAAVLSAQDHAPVTGRPAAHIVGEAHRSQHQTGWHVMRLPPGSAVIIRQQHRAVIADRDDALPGAGGAQHAGARRRGQVHRRKLVQLLDELGHVAARAPAARADELRRGRQDRQQRNCHHREEPSDREPVHLECAISVAKRPGCGPACGAGKCAPAPPPGPAARSSPSRG